MKAISASEVREWLDYDPETGVFVRRKEVAVLSPRGGRIVRARAGTVAGTQNSHGYLVIGIAGRKFLAHRLAWLLVHGEMPRGHLDHADADRGNNRIANLRRATRAQNGANRRANRNSRSGLKGVAYDARFGRWMARITKDGKRHALGYFYSAEAAHAAYCRAARAMHGEFARAK